MSLFLAQLTSLLFTLCIGPFAYLVFGHLASTTSLAKMGGYVNSGIVIFSALFGVYFLGERPNKLTWVALGVIVLGVALLSFGKVQSTES